MTATIRNVAKIGLVSLLGLGVFGCGGKEKDDSFFHNGNFRGHDAGILVDYSGRKVLLRDSVGGLVANDYNNDGVIDEISGFSNSYIMLNKDSPFIPYFNIDSMEAVYRELFSQKRAIEITDSLRRKEIADSVYKSMIDGGSE